MNNQPITSIKALSAAAAIIFAVGLHPASANAQAGGAPTGLCLGSRNERIVVQ